MKIHKINLHSTTVEVTSLAQLLKRKKMGIYRIADTLAINYRSAKNLLQEPETLSIRELIQLAEELDASEHELLGLIRDEYQSRPAPPPSGQPKPPARRRPTQKKSAALEPTAAPPNPKNETEQPRREITHRRKPQQDQEN